MALFEKLMFSPGAATLARAITAEAAFGDYTNVADEYQRPSF